MEKYEVHVEGRLRTITKIITNTPQTFKAYYYNHHLLITPVAAKLLMVVTTPQGKEIVRRKDYKIDQMDAAIKNAVSEILENYKKT